MESENKTSSNKKYIIFLILVVFVVVLAALAVYFFTQPIVKDERIFVSNISNNKVTISWVTSSPVREWVTVTEKGSNTPKIFKDNKEASFLLFSAYSLHYVTAENLNPNTDYTYKIIQNFRKTDSGTFTTGPRSSGVDVSKVVTGQILSADKKTPASGVIVYIQLSEGAGQSTLLSATADSEGKWSANILGARTSDLKDGFQIASRSAALVIAEAGVKGRFFARFAVDNKIKSLPSIILKGAQ